MTNDEVQKDEIIIRYLPKIENQLSIMNKMKFLELKFRAKKVINQSALAGYSLLESLDEMEKDIEWENSKWMAKRLNLATEKCDINDSKDV